MRKRGNYMEKFEYCENIIKESSQSFYKAFSQLEEKRAQAVFAVYAFCRTADDAVDKHDDIERVHTLKKQIKQTFEGSPPDDPLFQALSEVIETFSLELDPYLDLLDGMRDDYYNKPIETEAQFDEYCYKAAGSVGLMLLPILAKDKLKSQGKQLKAVAIELGKAMQITNILRDVKEDFMKDRIYFPDEILEQFQVNIEILRTGLVVPEWRALMEHYIDVAKNKYQVFYENINLFDKDAIFPTYLAALFYEGILDVIQKSNYSNLNKRYSTGKFKKFLLGRKAKKNLKRKGLMS